MMVNQARIQKYPGLRGLNNEEADAVCCWLAHHSEMEKLARTGDVELQDMDLLMNDVEDALANAIGLNHEDGMNFASAAALIKWLDLYLPNNPDPFYKYRKRLFA